MLTSPIAFTRRYGFGTLTLKRQTGDFCAMTVWCVLIFGAIDVIQRFKFHLAKADTCTGACTVHLTCM